MMIAVTSIDDVSLNEPLRKSTSAREEETTALLDALNMAREQAEYFQSRYEQLTARHLQVEAASAQTLETMQERYETLLNAHMVLLAQVETLESINTQLLSTGATISSNAPTSNWVETMDPFQAINGIGPALEHTLYALGYTCFEQIASWSERDVERVSGQLNCFPGRIEADRWIEQANALVAQKRAGYLGK